MLNPRALNQDVRGLQVAMDDRGQMRVMHRLGDLDHEADRLLAVVQGEHGQCRSSCRSRWSGIGHGVRISLKVSGNLADVLGRLGRRGFIDEFLERRDRRVGRTVGSLYRKRS